MIQIALLSLLIDRDEMLNEGGKRKEKDLTIAAPCHTGHKFLVV